MVSLYLFCLIVGGGLLLFSLLGYEGDAEGGSELEAHADAAEIEGDASASVEHGWGIAQEFFSIRSLFYLLAGFGATGLLLETLTAASSTTAFAWALITGLVAALMAGLVYGWLKRSESGMLPESSDHLVGLPAEVVLPVIEGRRGKVRLIAGGREIEMLARLYGAEDAACLRGSTVVIVDIEGDTALITPAPSLPSGFQEE
jgi:membrane protein implicated in regulation of membrane protease activity